MNDLLVGGSRQDCESLLLSLNKTFLMSDVGECTWYDECGIERNAASGTIKLSQEAYVESLMTRFDEHTISGTIASPGANLESTLDDESGGDWPVREVVGSLL